MLLPFHVKQIRYRLDSVSNHQVDTQEFSEVNSGLLLVLLCSLNIDMFNGLAWVALTWWPALQLPLSWQQHYKSEGFLFTLKGSSIPGLLLSKAYLLQITLICSRFSEFLYGNIYKDSCCITDIFTHRTLVTDIAQH